MLKRPQDTPPPGSRDPKETKRKRSSSGSGDSPSETAGSSAEDAPPPAAAARSSSDGSDGSHYTGTSDHSSQQNVDPLKVQSIFVSSHVVFTHQEDAPSIHFYLNAEQRPDTRIQGQGDHITSYTLIIQALLSSAEDNIRSAIISIKKLAETTLEEAELAKFNEIKEPPLHTHEQRKRVVKLLEDAEGKEVASRFNKELKYAKMSVLSNYLALLTNQVLRGLQQHELATTFSKGRIGKDPQEGPNAKTAARALVALNQIYQWAAMDSSELDEDRIEKMLHALSSKKLTNPADTEEQHIMRYGISALSGNDGGVTADRLMERIKRDRGDANKIKDLWEEIGNRFKSEVDKIAKFIGDLYDYRRVLTFNLHDAFPLPTNIKAQGDNAVLTYWKDKLKSPFGDGYIFDIDVNNGSAMITRTGIENLIQTIYRHIIIIKSAFTSLVDKVRLEQVINIFIQKSVLKEQKWEEHSEKKILITLDYLKSALRELETNKNFPSNAGSSNYPS